MNILHKAKSLFKKHYKLLLASAAIIFALSLYINQRNKKQPVSALDDASALTLEGVMLPDNLDFQEFYEMHKTFSEAEGEYVLLVIDSPGGAFPCIIQYVNEMEACKRIYNKKVIVYIPSLCASGGVYATGAADLVVSDPNAFFGSIGVLYMYPTGPIEPTDIIVASPRANRAVPYFTKARYYDDNEGLYQLVDEFYSERVEAEELFFEFLRKTRGVDPEELKKLQGAIHPAYYPVFSEIGLIDALMPQKEFTDYVDKVGIDTVAQELLAKVSEKAAKEDLESTEGKEEELSATAAGQVNE